MHPRSIALGKMNGKTFLWNIQRLISIARHTWYINNIHPHVCMYGPYACKSARVFCNSFCFFFFFALFPHLFFIRPFSSLYEKQRITPRELSSWSASYSLYHLSTSGRIVPDFSRDKRELVHNWRQEIVFMRKMRTQMSRRWKIYMNRKPELCVLRINIDKLSRFHVPPILCYSWSNFFFFFFFFNFFSSTGEIRSLGTM